MHTHYSLHKITHSTQFSFDEAAYSRFKFGDGFVAKEYGISLAHAFIEYYAEALHGQKQLVVISSPYCFIPTATFAMKTYFVHTLNTWLAENNYPVVQETKIHRTITYKEDYGALDAEERLKLIGNDHFHIDKEFIRGKLLIFLDDIRITGSHEKMIQKMIDAYELENDYYLLYFAELVNHEIHPNIENYLNYYAVKTIFDLNQIVSNPSFVINTRFVKYLLIYDQSDFEKFILEKESDFVQLVYFMALGNSYHTIEEYKKNLHYLKNIINNNNNKNIHYGN